MRKRGSGSPPSRCETSRWEPWVIETTTWAPRPVRSPLEQRGEHRDRGLQGARGEVGQLHGRQGGRGVGKHAGPAEVVEVVAGAVGVRALGTEAGDRAVDDPLRKVGGAEPEPLGDAGAKALEHDVGARAQRPREAGIRLEVADDRLLAGPESGVPRRGDVPHRDPRSGASTRTTRAPSRSSSLPA